MYTRREIYELFQACQTWRELTFLAKWFNLLIETGLEDRLEFLKQTSDERFSEIEKLNS